MKITATVTLTATSAYLSQEFLAEFSGRCFRDRLNGQGKRNKPLTGNQKRGNRSKSRNRCRVKHVFGAMKQHCGAVLASTVGLAGGGKQDRTLRLDL